MPVPSLNRDPLRAELTRFPKAPVDDVVTSVGAQSKAIVAAGVAMLLTAAALYGASLIAAKPKGWEIAAAVISAISLTPLLAGLLTGLWAWTQQKKLRELAGGMYWVHWQYGPQQWDEHCQRSEKNLRWLVSAFAGGGAVLALLFAGMVHADDGQLFFGSIASHYGLCLAAGAAGGAAVGAFCRHMAGITQRLRRTKAAQALIGPAGVYVTGLFSPMKTFGYDFKQARLPSEEPGVMTFVFRVKTKHGWQDSPLSVPVPPGQEAVAKILLQILGAGAD